MALSDIVFIGSNPSQTSQSNSAFDIDTKSWKTLCDWIDAANIAVSSFENISHEKTPNNRPLNAEEIEAGMRNLVPMLERRKFDKIVSVGKVADKALTKYGIPHLALPHPSGLNRQLNDPKFVELTIQRLKEYYHGEG